MLLTNFLALAREKSACNDGLMYLQRWMRENPTKKTTTQYCGKKIGVSHEGV